MKTKLLLLSAFLILFFYGCKDNMFCIKGEGDLVDENRTISNFSKVDMSIVGNIFLKQSDSTLVTISAEENLIEEIKTEINGSTLVIKSRKCLSPNQPINIYIFVPQLDEISCSGKGNIMSIENWDFASDVTFNLTGEGQINFSNFTCNGDIEANVVGSGDIDLEHFTAKTLNSKITGTGDITANDVSGISSIVNNITGQGNIYVASTDTLETNEINITGNGNVNEFEVISNKVDVDISGNGNVYVTALKNLNVSVSGIGDIYYKGSPQVVSDISGVGKINDVGK